MLARVLVANPNRCYYGSTTMKYVFGFLLLANFVCLLWPYASRDASVSTLPREYHPERLMLLRELASSPRFAASEPAHEAHQPPQQPFGAKTTQQAMLADLVQDENADRL
jgi:hypothetical protein